MTTDQFRNVAKSFGRSRRVHHRDRHQHTILIALAALPGATLPRLRALALFGRRSPQRVDSLVMPASENLHNCGHRPDFMTRHMGRLG